MCTLGYNDDTWCFWPRMYNMETGRFPKGTNLSHSYSVLINFQGRMTVFAGIGCIISGICLGIAASMWAYRLVTDFYGFAR